MRRGREEELAQLRRVARRTRRPVAALVRDAVRRVWLRPRGEERVALCNGTPGLTSIELVG